MYSNFEFLLSGNDSSAVADDVSFEEVGASKEIVSRSRVAKQRISIPAGVKVILTEMLIDVSGPKGALTFDLPRGVMVSLVENGSAIKVIEAKSESYCVMMAGTVRSLINNMVVGVSVGFTRALQLVGVGYKVALSGSILTFNLGYSHPVIYTLPESVSAVCHSPTEIVLSSYDKRLIGTVAREIRALRSPNRYSGKGVQFKGEIGTTFILKEGGKKK